MKNLLKCADWEIAGGFTLVDGKRIKDEGLLEKFDVNIKEARNLIMKARLEMGWISNEDYEKEISDQIKNKYELEIKLFIVKNMEKL